MSGRAPRHARAHIGAWVSFALASSLVILLATQGSASAAAPTAQIEGSGSSWASNAVNQWVSDVFSQGVGVVYTADGDAQGRTDFANKTSDLPPRHHLPEGEHFAQLLHGLMHTKSPNVRCFHRRPFLSNFRESHDDDQSAFKESGIMLPFQ